MKYILIFFALFLAAFATWTPSTKDDFLKYRLDCFKETNVSEANIEKIKKHQFSDDNETYCYIHCIGLKLGTWDDKKGYHVDRVYETLKGHNFDMKKEDLSNCFYELMDADVCTWAARNWLCLWTNKYITKKNQL